MSKKRGPNSPMESEKNKQKGQSASTSAAAATLSMASMLSVVSGAFSSKAADSVVSDTDSDGEYTTQSETGSGTNTIQDGNVWSEPNCRKVT